jgi:hypothetical protein
MTNFVLPAALIIFLVVAIAIAAEVHHVRERRRRRAARPAARERRQELLEAAVAEAAFAQPRSFFGDCIHEFSIWRLADNVRMDVVSRGTWSKLNKAARCTAVRHFWRALKALTDGTVTVVVDAGKPDAIKWTAEHTAALDQRGVKAPWEPSGARAGTLISGPDPRTVAGTK